ncbi:MAG: hypothetical protein ACOCUL_02795, partial [Bacteroidota bacterium]
MKRLLYIFLFIFFVAVGNSQDFIRLETKKIMATHDTILFDTVSIVPNSLLLRKNHSLIPGTSYQVDYANAWILINDSSLFHDTLDITYRAFSFSFTKTYFHKDKSLIRSDDEQADPGFWYVPAEDQYQTLLFQDKLKKSGSIARGIQFGNNQDMSVSSNLNLQISGKLTDDLDIMAAITDNNIPIQPDGYSQQLQEFDKVYIKLGHQASSLTAGDFELTRPNGYFLHFTKKAQGGYFETQFSPGKEKDKMIQTSVAGAVSKGKFARNSLHGSEGNQGPYRLRGANNESYIIILAGSERVYLDGKLLARGEENDYVINYNSAEITFTPRQPITKDKRIVVEFEYSEQNYARFLLYNTTTFQSGENKFWLNLYSEQDGKNQPLQQDLSETDKFFLSNIGDSLHQGIVKKIIYDTVFDGNKILYKLVDTTLANGEHYDSIFIHSTNPTDAHFRLSFSYVGENNGNYIISRSSSNGRVFEWIAPVSGTPSGNYEPYILLVTPRKKQVAALGGDISLTNHTKAYYELAVSNNDINTFSKKDKSDDKGYALKLKLEQDIPISRSSETGISILTSYELVNKHFDPVERFRPVEFERDWNLLEDAKENTHVAALSMVLNHSKFSPGYTLEYMSRGEEYSGLKNNLSFTFTGNNSQGYLNGSILNSNDPFNETRFYRYSAGLSRDLSFSRIGISSKLENNQWFLQGSDSLLINSFSFREYTAFMENPDTSKNLYRLSYAHRTDYLPLQNHLEKATISDDVSFQYEFLEKENHQWKTLFTYRKLKITDTLVSQNTPEENLTGRIQHSYNFLKRTFGTSTFYEIGSGLEAKKEFSYIEVGAGQGVFQWTDYNNNGQKELDEFEIAAFQDQANYIRVFFPSDQYEKIFSNQFNQVFSIKPFMAWKKSSGIKKLISRFSNQLAYRVERKISNANFLVNINPFANIEKINEIKAFNQTIRNTFSFNKYYPKIGIDYVFQENKNSTLLIFGLDNRQHRFHGTRFKYRLSSSIILFNNSDLGEKSYSSSFFPHRNYDLQYWKNIVKIDFASSFKWKFSLSYEFEEKDNLLGFQNSKQHDLGIEIDYHLVKNGIISLRSNYIKQSFNDSPASPLAYEMLEG